MKQPILPLRFTGPGADMVLRGLGMLPYAEVAPLIAEIHQQIVAFNAKQPQKKKGK